jgi:hypothetical protein
MLEYVCKVKSDGGMARTAAIVGKATATRNAVNRRRADKNVASYSHAVEQANVE